MNDAEASYNANPTKLLEKETFLLNNHYLSGRPLPGEEDARVFAMFEEAPDRQKYPNLFFWWWTLVSFSEEARQLWALDKHKGDSVDEDEDLVRPTASSLHSDSSQSNARVVVEVFREGVCSDLLLEFGRELTRSIREEGICWGNEMSVKEEGAHGCKLNVFCDIDTRKIHCEDLRQLIKARSDDSVSCEIVRG